MNPIINKIVPPTKVLGAPFDWNKEELGECKGLPITELNGVMYSGYAAPLIIIERAA